MIHPVIRNLTLMLGLLIAACAAPMAPVAEEAPPPDAVATQPVQIPDPAPFVAPEPEPLAVDMARIENQTPTNVVSYLGTPTLVRRDGSVQVMIFETGTCVVEVIFYEPANGDHFRAHRVNSRSRSGQDVDTENCVRQQLEQKQ